MLGELHKALAKNLTEEQVDEALAKLCADGMVLKLGDEQVSKDLAKCIVELLGKTELVAIYRRVPGCVTGPRKPRLKEDHCRALREYLNGKAVDFDPPQPLKATAPKFKSPARKRSMMQKTMDNTGWERIALLIIDAAGDCFRVTTAYSLGMQRLKRRLRDEGVPSQEE